jgi:hypothetical protein
MNRIAIAVKTTVGETFDPERVGGAARVKAPNAAEECFNGNTPSAPVRAASARACIRSCCTESDGRPESASG